MDMNHPQFGCELTDLGPLMLFEARQLIASYEFLGFPINGLKSEENEKCASKIIFRSFEQMVRQKGHWPFKCPSWITESFHIGLGKMSWRKQREKIPSHLRILIEFDHLEGISTSHFHIWPVWAWTSRANSSEKLFLLFSFFRFFVNKLFLINYFALVLLTNLQNEKKENLMNY